MPPTLRALAVLVLAGCSHGSGNEIPPPGPLETSPQGACKQTPIYFLANADTEAVTLMSFDPASMAFATVGPVHCPGELLPAGPIAVDHTGQIYSLDDEGCGMQRIFRIDPATLACTETPGAQSRSADQRYVCTWSMTFAPDAASPAGETLFAIQSVDTSMTAPYVLGRVDPSTSAFGIVAPLPAGIQDAMSSGHSGALTSNGKGELYAAVDAQVSLHIGSQIVQVDPSTAATTFRWQLNGVPPPTAVNYHAFAEWGGDFYFFVEPQRQQVQVVRFRPSDSSTTTVAQATGFDVGFDVATSTCTP